MKTILRYYVHTEHAARQLDEIRSFCQRTGCDEVMLLSSGYFTQPSFIPLDQVARYAESLAGWAQTLRSAGLTVSLNVIQTLGHRCFPRASAAAFPFQRQVHLDGIESPSTACPLDRNLRAYQGSAYRLYAAIQPRLLFVDDDFRYIMSGTGCCCPLHLDRISARAGSTVTYEQVVRALSDTALERSPLALLYHEVASEALISFATELGDVVHAASPATRVGIMSSGVPHATWGCDLDAVIQACAGAARPAYRPQMPMYAEGGLRDMPRQMIQPALARNLLGAEVEVFPEIENAWYSLYAKSAQVTFVQMATCVLHGLDNLTLLLFDWLATPFSESEGYTAMLAGRQEWFLALQRLIPPGSRTHGIAIPLHPRNARFHRPLTEGGRVNPRSWDSIIPLLGLPVGLDWSTSPFVLLTDDDVLAMNHEEIEAYLSRGVVMDVRAAECLVHRGFSSRIGISIGERLVCTDDLFVERYDQPGSPIQPWMPDGGMIFKRIVANAPSTVRVDSRITTASGLEVAPAVITHENHHGERFAVIAFSLEAEPRKEFLNPFRQRQLAKLFSWVARRPLPVVVHQVQVQPLCISRETGMTIGLLNFSTDPVPELDLQIDGFDGSGCRIWELSPTGALTTPLSIRAGPQPGRVLIVLCHRLEAAGVCVLNVEH